mgnify:CR=1 FL=1|tara:strand:- start:103 stop:372 length:270 start_codon:yes stop_codon:yes gene_type:complete
MSRAYKTIASSSVGAAYTGSIAKVIALGADGDESTLSRIEFGAMTYPESHFTASSIITTNVQIPAGSPLEGPIGRIKVGAGGFLIYFDN